MSELEAEALSGTAGLPNATPLRTASIHIQAWVPLRRSLFRALWLASFVSNIGSFMHEVGAAWLMTGLKPIPWMVSLVQAAANLPVFLLALPAGAIADVVDRRLLIIWTQLWMGFCAGVLAAFTYADMTGPWMLLTFTFLLSVGGAMTWPAWQAITPELVEKHEVPAAIALGGIGFNLSRIVGPAIGGFIVGSAGPAAVFLANALSYIAIVGVLIAWRRKPIKRRLPPETIVGAMRSGVRYLRFSPALRAILIRCGSFILCSGCYWAILPLLARQDIGLDSTHYGLLLGWFGAGAVVAGLVLPKLRKYVSSNTLVTLTCSLVALQMAALAYVRERHSLHLIMVFGGFVWSSAMLCFNIAVLHAAPEWVRSRAAALFLLVFTGGQTVSSIVWGAVATRYSMPTALIVAAGALLAVVAITSAFYRMPASEKYNLSPGGQSQLLPLDDDLEHDEGPVLVLVKYFIRAQDLDDFHAALWPLRRIRLRDGASQWGLFRDTSTPDLYVETFLVPSWIDHLRQHERMTVDDLAAEKRAMGFHSGDVPPEVVHYVASG
ncbi:MAG: MFS transporter [Candidatus Sumerlaeaceae bacterium]